MTNNRPSQSQWDLFIAHASEDKNDFVRPLAERLDDFGVRVWYDEFQLLPGDSLLDTIDRGLLNSTYGLLIISPAFLHKPWPEYERRGLTTRELAAGRNLVIPVWLNVTQAEVTRFSPSLADKFALHGRNVETLSIEVLRTVRPDIAEHLQRRIARQRYVAGLPTEVVPIEMIELNVPVRREKLPLALMYRLLLIHESALDVVPLPFEDTVLNFKKDLDPEKEAGVWEILVATYLYVVREDKIPAEGRTEVMSVALRASMGDLDENDFHTLGYTTVGRIQEVKGLMNRRIEEHSADG